MEAGGWKLFFTNLRVEDQKALMVALTNGMQVSVQEVMIVEDTLAVIRGRVAGQADTGRMFIVPFDQMSLVYVNRNVMREEAELFAPGVSLERKEQVAKMVAEILEKAKREAKDAERSRDDQRGGAPVDLVRQLEELRQSAGLDAPPGGAPAPAPAAPATAPAKPSGPGAIPPPPPPAGPGAIPPPPPVPGGIPKLPGAAEGPAKVPPPPGFNLPPKFKK